MCVGVGVVSTCSFRLETRLSVSDDDDVYVLYVGRGIYPLHTITLSNIEQKQNRTEQTDATCCLRRTLAMRERNWKLDFILQLQKPMEYGVHSSRLLFSPLFACIIPLLINQHPIRLVRQSVHTASLAALLRKMADFDAIMLPLNLPVYQLLLLYLHFSTGLQNIYTYTLLYLSKIGTYSARIYAYCIYNLME